MARPKKEPEHKPEPKPDTVLMERDGKVAQVRNNESVAIMEAQGWKVKQ